MWRFIGQLGCVLWALALWAVPTYAQVVARQGGEEAEKVTEFVSPMVLELPFAVTAALPEGAAKSFENLSKFVCDDTLLTRLTAKRVRASAKRGDRYVIDGTVFVRRSHDRLVSLTLELLVGEERVAMAVKEKINAEENTSRTFSLQLSLSPTGTAKLAENPDSAVLKVTVNVKDND